MTKADIINEISAETGVAKKDVTVVVEAFMDAVKNNLLKKENVYLRGFGSFIHHQASCHQDCSQHLEEHNYRHRRSRHPCLQAC